MDTNHSLHYKKKTNHKLIKIQHSPITILRNNALCYKLIVPMKGKKNQFLSKMK